MSPGLSSLSGAATGSIETALGFALGFAAADALGPLSTTIRQEAYAADPSMALDPAAAARIVAQALKALEWGEKEAGASGINPGKFDLLQQSELRAPAVGELLQLIRRGYPDKDQIAHALRKNQLEPEWDSMLTRLSNLPLQGAELANAIHRGNMPDEGLLPFKAPTTAGKVGQYAISSLNPVTQAAWSGTSKEQLAVLVANAGLPLALMEMLGLLNRGLVTADDVKRSIAHSNIRNEYMDVAIALKRRLLTPSEYEEAALRGVISRAEADKGAGLSGVEPGDAQLLFEIMGRPLAVHQLTTGLERGGDYGGTYDDIPEPYRDAVRRSNIRPEYAKLAYANRYTYPSAFVLRSLVQGGELSEKDGHTILLEIGWPPDLAEKVAKVWGGTTTAAADPHVSKAQTQLWTKLHTSYVDNLSTETEAQADLATIGVAAAAIPEVLSLWKAERSLIRRSLTPAQLKKAAVDKLMTTAEATARLLELGYSKEDAGDVLSE